MKQILIMSVATLVLAACGGPRQKLLGLCTGMLEGDPEAIEELASHAASPADF